jgi:hypothetical protein
MTGSDAIGRPDRPLTVTVPAEHAALMRGPALADAVADVIAEWTHASDVYSRVRVKVALQWGELADALDALARAAGRDVPNA